MVLLRDRPENRGRTANRQISRKGAEASINAVANSKRDIENNDSSAKSAKKRRSM